MGFPPKNLCVNLFFFVLQFIYYNFLWQVPSWILQESVLEPKYENRNVDEICDWEFQGEQFLIVYGED